MLNLVSNTGMSEGVAKDFMNIYELFLVQGATKGIARAKVCELFSPPRVTDEIRRLPNITIAGGATYDLVADRNGRTFDFTKAADRRKVRREIEETETYFVIGSPPCAAFSSLMTFNRGKMGNKYKKQLAEGRLLLKFAAEIYELQLRWG